MKMDIGNHVLTAKMCAPCHGDERPRRDRPNPRAHEEPEAIQRALEMRIEGHREVPRHDDPEQRERKHHVNCELALQGVRRMELSAFFTEVASHAFSDALGPRRAVLGDDADVKAYARVDVPDAEQSLNSEHHEIARDEEWNVQILPLLLDHQRVLSPREDVIAPEEQRQAQNYERDRQERDVPFHEPNHRTRPTRSGNSLDRNYSHAGRRHRTEKQPVEMNRLPGAVHTHESTDDERERSDNCQNRARHLEPPSDWRLRSAYYLVACNDMLFGVCTHGLTACGIPVL